ncbi:E3 ubiquitin-protein ligase UBR1 [Hondaea fermentalgiana]|uniref:E3 ubiquitin-protein ligase n=1 Tax=Hondaea fermentalgiana TaxID=2315210 RepID=A0A2R5G4R1_9STRA|nr:E3 ubiquitin-protein ligase UBR1 [Hondaea fermentalgiana]|eukprot:GBG26017.1 E3 ubiquitin-protein ligase UBR1 [Hondaea fermentalgiana]
MARGSPAEVGVHDVQQQGCPDTAAAPRSGPGADSQMAAASPMAAEHERILRRSRVRRALLDDEPPLAVPELQWWRQEGRGVPALCDAMAETLEEIVAEDANMDNEADLSRTMQRACMWFQHIICAEAVVSTLAPNTAWAESSAFCHARIRAATSREPQRVCSRAFRAGDIVWNCKQCQMDSTCVLCQECFRASDHEGHDVYFYHVMTDAGGCCDCGDPGAWDPSGFCNKHGESNVPEPKNWLPAAMEDAAVALLRRVVNLMAHFASSGRSDLILEPILDAMKQGAVFTTSPYREELTRISECLTFAVAPHAPLRPREPREEMSVPVLINNWFRRASKPDPFVFASVTRDNVAFCREFVKQMSDTTFFRMSVRNTVALSCSVAIEVISSWLQMLCGDSDSFTRLTARALTEGPPTNDAERQDMENQSLECTLLPLKNLIVHDLFLPSSTSKSLRSVYIRLLVDGLFKSRFAVAFAKTYRRSCAARIYQLPVLELGDTDTIFGLSVQFLNRPNHVKDLVKNYGFLESILGSLKSTVEHCISQTSQRGGETNETDSDSHLDLLSPVLTHRKTKCIVTDLTYVLNAPGMSLRFLAAQPQALGTLFELFDLLYNLHTQSRVCAPELPIRDERWVPAFNLSLSVLSLFVDLTRYFTFGLKNHAVTKDSPFATSILEALEALTADKEISGHGSHEAVTVRILRECAGLTAQILEKHAPAAQTVVYTDNVLGRLPYVACDVAHDPVTFHCALQRFFAMVYHQALASTLDPRGYRALLGSGSSGFWLALMRQPLSAIIISAQSAASMWLRNEDMASQAMNYQALPFVSGAFMDLRALQAAALEVPGNDFVNYLVNAYGLSKFFAFDRIHDTCEPPEEYEGSLGEHLLETLCRVATELPAPTPAALERSGFSKEDILAASDVQLRREIIHLLAIRSASFSAINDTCTHLRQVGLQSGADHLKRVLREVARMNGHGDGLRPVEYNLKPESWLEFDPLFHRLSRQDKSQAREHSLTFRVRENISKPCFPGDSKPRGASSRVKPLPSAPWHTFVHPAYAQVRTKLLLCDATFLLLHRSLSRAVAGRDAQCGVLFLANAIHLLSLQVHLIREISGDDATGLGEEDETSAEATAGASAAGKNASAMETARGSADDEASFTSVAAARLRTNPPWSRSAVRLAQKATPREFAAEGSLALSAGAISAGTADASAPLAESTSSATSVRASADEPKTTLGQSGSSQLLCAATQPDHMSYTWLADTSASPDEMNMDEQMHQAERAGSSSSRSSHENGRDGEVEGQEGTSCAHTTHEEEDAEDHDEHPAINTCARFGAKVMTKVEGSDQSILDCLLKMWHDDSVSIDEATRDGVRWILFQLNRLDASCHKRIRAEFKSRKSESLSEKEKQSRKRKAQRSAQHAQRNAMSAMKQFQAKAAEMFASEMDDGSGGGDSSGRGAKASEANEPGREGDANLSDTARDTCEKKQRSEDFVDHMDDDEDDDVDLAGASATAMSSASGNAHGAKQRETWRGPECVACHECKSLDEDSTCYIGFFHRNDVHVLQREETTAQGWCVSWPAGPPNRTILQLCGHAIHERCLQSYREASQADTGDALWINQKRQEFLCPLCKSLSNFVVPCVPDKLLPGPNDLTQNPPPRVSLSSAAAWFAKYEDVEDDLDDVEGGGGRSSSSVNNDFADREIDNMSDTGSMVRRDSSPSFQYGSSGDLRISSDLGAYGNGGGAIRSSSSSNDLLLAAPCSPRSLPLASSASSVSSGGGRRRGLSTNSWHGGSPVRPRSSMQPLFIIKNKHEALDPLLPAIKSMCDALSQNEVAQGSPRSRRMSESFAAQMIATATPSSPAEAMAMLDSLAVNSPRNLEVREVPSGQNFTSLCFSFALTVIAEQRARAERSVVPKERLQKLARLFRACRAALLANAGAGLQVLHAVLHESVSSSSRELRHHCVLNQSPELILVLSCLCDPTPQSCWTAVQALYTLKLAQSLLEGELTDKPSSTEVPSQISSAKSAVELSRVMLGKFERMSELTSPRAVQSILQKGGIHSAGTDQEKMEAHLTLLATSHVMEFLQLAQVMLVISTNQEIETPLDLVQWPSSGIGNGALTLFGVDMPMAKEVLESSEMMQRVSSWLDQVIACAPSWVPRPRMQPPPTSGAPRPLSVRQLIRLRHSYTEQYVEVNQAVGEHDPSHDPAICLVCGQMMLAGRPSRAVRNRRRDSRGECTRHTDETHDGVGALLLFRRSSTVLLIHGSHAAYWGSLYVDKNGDDQQVVPSLPMFLDKKRYERVEQLWAENRIPSQVASLRNTGQVVSGTSRNYGQVVIRANFY